MGAMVGDSSRPQVRDAGHGGRHHDPIDPSAGAQASSAVGRTAATARAGTGAARGRSDLNLRKRPRPHHEEERGDRRQHHRVEADADRGAVDEGAAKAVDAVRQRIEAGRDPALSGRSFSGKSAPDRKKIGMTRKFMIS